MVNISRIEKIDNKKQFFLWFAGSRGAMAFALSIKSRIDFPDAGNIFLVLTLIVASFTLIYSALFLNFVLKNCGLIDFCVADNFDDSSFGKKNCFDKFKRKISLFNKNYLKRFVKKTTASEESLVNRSINNENLRVNEVKNISTEDKRNRRILKCSYRIYNEILAFRI